MSWRRWWQRWWHGESRVESSELWWKYFGDVQVQDVLRFSVREIASSKQGRSVGKIESENAHGPLVVFLKRHYRLPWWQRVLSLFVSDQSSAMQEWRNLCWAQSVGLCVPEPLAAGEQIGPGLRLQSFLAVRELTNMLPLHRAIPLAWQTLPREKFEIWKGKLLRELACVVRQLHQAQRFHKDLYLCHFYISAEDLRSDADLHRRLYLIDLHRMRHHRWLTTRWRVKDLAQLAFSMSVPGLEPADWQVFFRAYLDRDTLLPADKRLMWRVWRKAQRYCRQNARHKAWQLTSYFSNTARTVPPSTVFLPMMRTQPATPKPVSISDANASGNLPPSSQVVFAPKDVPVPARLRIALCYDKVYPERGGMEVFIVDLIRRLTQDGHEVHLFAWQRDVEALPSSLVFHQLPHHWTPRFLRPWQFAQECERALKQHRFDVTVGFVKTWGQDVLILGGGLHVANADHNLLKYKSRWARWLARAWRNLDICYWSYLLLERQQIARRYRPLVVAVSDMVKRHCQEYYHIPAEQIRVIHAAIDPKRFCQRGRLCLREETRRMLGVLPQESVALFVGHNYALKGLVPLLHAMHVLRGKPIHLLVCGSRKDEQYRQLAARLGILDRVHFLGYQRDVRRCFFAADFMVHPTFYDPCSLVVMEALACGLPVVTTRYNGAAELLTPPLDGFVLDDPHDHWRLAEYLDLLSQPDIRQKCSQHAQQAASRWTMEHLYQALLGVFYEVAARKHPQTPQNNRAGCTHRACGLAA